MISMVIVFHVLPSAPSELLFQSSINSTFKLLVCYRLLGVDCNLSNAKIMAIKAAKRLTSRSGTLGAVVLYIAVTCYELCGWLRLLLVWYSLVIAVCQPNHWLDCTVTVYCNCQFLYVSACIWSCCVGAADADCTIKGTNSPVLVSS